MNKAYFGVGKMKRLHDILPRDSLVSFYKSFIRSYLDYGDVIYDQPNNDSFTDKIEQLQYKGCLAITGAIQGTLRECLYNELGLESLSSRRWCRKLSAIYKLLSTQCPKYLFDIIPSSENFFDTSKKQRPFFNCRTGCFRYSFFPNSLSECSQLAPEIQNSESIAVFKNKLLSLKRSNVNHPEGIKYLTRLRLRFSHLNENKFRYVSSTLNPLCNYSLEVEDSEHLFLRCLNLGNAWKAFFINIWSINSSLKTLPSHLKVELLLFGDAKLSTIDNNLILKASIKYIMTASRFSVLLFWYCFPFLALNIFNFLSSGVHPPPSPLLDFFHCSIWESTEIYTCTVFSCLFFGYFVVKYFSFVFCLVQLQSIIL